MNCFRAAGLVIAFRGCALASFFLLSGPALAAGFTCAQPDALDAPPPAKNQIPELDEVIVTPGKSVRRTRDLGAWLKRLEGQYTYEGHVDLCGNGNAADQRPVTGKADCASLYDGHKVARTLSLYCMIDVRWPQVRDEDGMPVPGSEAGLSPALMVFGVVPDLPGIQFMQIDNKGMATHAQGSLTGDTLITRASCGSPGSCQQGTRITARRDSAGIFMLVDIETEAGRVLRQAFVLRRVSNVQMRPGRRQDLESVGER